MTGKVILVGEVRWCRQRVKCSETDRGDAIRLVLARLHDVSDVIALLGVIAAAWRFLLGVDIWVTVSNLL